MSEGGGLTSPVLVVAPWSLCRSEWGGELTVGGYELGGGRGSLDPPFRGVPSAVCPSRCPVGRWEGWRFFYTGAQRVRFRAVVGRVEWRVVHDVEEARGSWGGRGACGSMSAGSRLTAIVH